MPDLKLQLVCKAEKTLILSITSAFRVGGSYALPH
jgi:hypothetical protein